MFNIFSFQINGILGLGQAIYSILENVDVNKISNQYANGYFNTYKQEEKEEIEELSQDFIELQRHEEAYTLIINLKGIDLRDLSIRYEDGMIEINLKRVEIEKDVFNKIANNSMVQKRYNMKFKDIEDIDTSQLMKMIDNGIFKIQMPKKYVINESSNIIDVENYIRK